MAEVGDNKLRATKKTAESAKRAES